jgi:hypothetical protein
MDGNVSGGGSGVIDSANHVVALAFKFADAEIPLLPSQLEQALTSVAVQESIKKTMQQFAETKIASGTTVVSADESKKLLESLQTGVTDEAKKSLESQIKKVPQFIALESSLKEFQKSVSSTGLGVFIDKNKGILYVVGAALVVGGAGALYVTRSGGNYVEKPVDLIKGKDFKVLSIGTFELKAGLLDFKPDARIFGAKLEVDKSWERVKVNFKLGVLAEGSKIQEVTGSAIVKSGAFSLSADGSYKAVPQNIHLGLKFDYHTDFGKDKFSLSAGAFYDDSVIKGTLGADYKFNKGPSIGLNANVGGINTGSVNYQAMLKLTVPINFP